ncbi:hypothetical protein ABMA32_19555 [Mesorhizobium sp. VNQ89]|uniref:hypothetical protein n=1 Tax=Mesorhizobium quangtriensis TaxID=3157709 RepID=UPI0032B87727
MNTIVAFWMVGALCVWLVAAYSAVRMVGLTPLDKRVAISREISLFRFGRIPEHLNESALTHLQRMKLARSIFVALVLIPLVALWAVGLLLLLL